MVSFRLSTALKRQFTIKTSIVGYIVLIVGVLGIAVFTIFTKGRQTICKPGTFSSTEGNNDLGKFQEQSCSSTIIYSGQTFSTPAASFVWSSLTWSNYTKPVPLENCKLLEGSRMQVISLIRSTPTVNWNLTYVCTPSSPIASRVNVWQGIDLYPNSMVLTVDSLGQGSEIPGIDNPLWIAIKTASMAVRGSNLVCSGSPFQGFEVYSNGAVAYMADSASGAACKGDGSSALDQQLISLFYNSTGKALNDLQTSLSPIPNVLFPCLPCSLAWHSVSEIIWTLLVALGSLFSVTFLVARLLMEFMEGEPKDEARQRDSTMRLTQTPDEDKSRGSYVNANGSNLPYSPLQYTPYMYNPVEVR